MRVHETKKYNTLSEFYPYYLSQHTNSICRSLHFVGTFLVIINVAYSCFIGSGTQLLWHPPLFFNTEYYF
ncbi:MAG: DUF962 domain-containing protein [Bacteriovoracaceae bacterium]|nr:DUF962 domain-containing protein [Bacteriovoracaceae bacterium]